MNLKNILTWVGCIAVSCALFYPMFSSLQTSQKEFKARQEQLKQEAEKGKELDAMIERLEALRTK